MKICFVYPAFERHADAHPELRRCVPAKEYLGPPSLGIAAIAAMTPEQHELEFIDDRVTPFSFEHDADLFAISCFTPAATRALEIAAALEQRGKPVVIGGLFPSMMPDECQPHCDAVVVGEGEPVWAEVLADAAAGRLRPRYEAKEPADLSMLPRPRVELYLDAEDARLRPDDYPLQISRGCPFHCDACVLPEQLGKRLRFYPDEAVLETLAVLARHGKAVSLTEDTSVFGVQGARRVLRRLLQKVIELQQEGLAAKLSYVGTTMSLIASMDRSLLELLAQAGLDRFYLVGGFDPITRAAFGRGEPAALEKSRIAVARCREAGLDPYVSFLVGNPDDDERVFDRVLAFTRRAAVDLAEFAIATPYPGTPIWRRYLAEGRIFDRTWKHYNDANVVFRPHNMSPERLLEGYLYLWREFYRGRDDLVSREEIRQTIQF